MRSVISRRHQGYEREGCESASEGSYIEVAHCIWCEAITIDPGLDTCACGQERYPVSQLVKLGVATKKFLVRDESVEAARTELRDLHHLLKNSIRTAKSYLHKVDVTPELDSALSAIKKQWDLLRKLGT